MRSQNSHPVSSKNGFALVVTLSLMILLTIIAVGLLSLASITLRTSSLGDAGAIARANARLSLMLAIGELQREMGPDSRISAPHDAGTDSKGGLPRWTAVYDAWKTPEDPSTPETPQTRSPKFRAWLVSNATDTTAEKIPLVGSGSLKNNSPAEDQIKAPSLSVKTGKQQGRFAWWASDESAKAKINAGLENSDGKEVPANPLVDAQSPPYIGHKAVTELAAFDWETGQRSAAITNGVVNLTAGLKGRGIGGINHDITVHSAGVLCDVREGRLKRDLSNLLSRPVTELENKPLYLADGRINRFKITDDGAVSNIDALPANAAGANRWGINLEELHLFHQLHREIDWSSGKPQLVNKNSKEEMAKDRFFLYRKPKMEAQNVMMSFIAEPDTAPNTYRIAAMIDAMVVNSNPNDIPIVWPAGVLLRMEMEGFPYRPKWNIRSNNTVKHSHTVQAINYPYFRSSISGGFTLDPGEAAVFGASSTDTSSESVNLKRGYKPRGGLRIDEKRWSTDTTYDPKVDGLRATGLLATDIMDFTMIPAPTNNGATPSGWISCYAKLRNISDANPFKDISLSTHRLAGGGGSLLTTAPINRYMPGSIRPLTPLPISAFIGNPLPVLMVTTMPNVEKSRIDLVPPNAFASRPYQLHEPAINSMVVSTTTPANTDLTMQNSQLVTIAETMEYEFVNRRSMAIDENGKERIYQGGGRTVETGGAFMAVKRRIPLAPPLSLGAFENAIACGLVERGLYLGGSNPSVYVGSVFRGLANGLPAMAKSIGNSWTNPFLNSNTVTDGTYHDPSWMANTALWDSWFLSGIVDGRGLGSNSLLNDGRSQREQFKDLAEYSGTLRNRRLAYNPRESSETAMNELFNGESLKPSAINKLPKYLLLDGAFNVNSTSLTAWKAFLTSVRDQELLGPSGTSKKNLPFGTLGYAAYDKTTKGYAEDWNGFKDLSDSEMDKLAANIVQEVKDRGPFLSMADFVNRRPNSSNDLHRVLGALQAAIDKSGLNQRYTDAERKLLASDIPSLAGKDTLNQEKVPARSIGSAGYLSQAALLSAFGSQIATRGDTFVIRTYGDARDASGKILAKAWCEAVVQRFPEYVDATNLADTTEDLTKANSIFGRKFDIVSFRWLNPEEI